MGAGSSIHRLAFLLALSVGSIVGLFAALSPESGRSAAQKLERIETESLAPGESVTLTEDELNSYLKYQYASEMPDGVRDLRLSLLDNSGVAEGYVDIAKLQPEGASSLGMVGAMLFSGEKHIKARCRYTSAGGQGSVEVESVEIDGEPLSKLIVDLLITNVIQPNVEGFAVGKPAPLPANLRQIRLEAGRAVVISN